MVRTWLLVLAIITVATGWLLYEPLPSEHEYPLKLRLVVGLLKVARIASKTIAYFGGSYWYFGKGKGSSKILPKRSIPLEILDLDGIEAFLVYPKGFKERKSKQGAIIYYFGGGWTLGSPEQYLPFGELLANLSGMAVLIPRYRLAPEFPFPYPHEDCLKAAWIFTERCNKFNIDRDKIVISGDSAGGNLAVSVAFEVKFRMMVLIYPSLQFSNFLLPSYQQNEHSPFVNKEYLMRFIVSYLGYDGNTELMEALSNNIHVEWNTDPTLKAIFDRVDQSLLPEKFQKYTRSEDRNKIHKNKFDHLSKYKDDILSKISDIRMCPLIAADKILKQLPRTHVLTCEYDVLRDEAVIFVERLKKLGVIATLQHLDYGIHGHISLGTALGEKRSLKEVDILVNMIKQELQKDG